MDVHQLRAYLPGKGIINLLESPPLQQTAKLMNGGPGDEYGNQSFKAGGAILLPFANRIRGQLSADRQTLTAEIAGKRVKLAANWQGKKPGAPKHAMHGLILAAPLDEVVPESGPGYAGVTGRLTTDFQGHWLSKADLTFKAALDGDGFALSVTASNIGSEPMPVGVGWHPYFVLPSGDRTQARIHLPAAKRTLVNNYDDVFPTGKIVGVQGTPYDFSAPGGAPLGTLFLDDCFLDLKEDSKGRTMAEIVDPAAGYGLRITAVSPEIRAIQVYAPVDKSFVVLEPQFNLADPFSKVWEAKTNTGMVILAPGKSVTYSVRLQLFVP